ncbi:DNA polymerase subunit beta [Synechocystis salina LEGE 06099]|uniref:DNA polymerase subunit beta n=1 Tax=Synechocystis salina TaxID=945780 RepID=UPI001881633A|nr:DNA polymerase subunit beta [Synechocystis salina]MBE9202817.1 DNA polymerase subunit beta [Synechocystis salina LEGE 06099]
MLTIQSVKQDILDNSNKIVDFCQQWRVHELALCDYDYKNDSELGDDRVKFVITFVSDSPWTLLHLVDMEEQLQAIFGYGVSLVEKAGIEQSRNELTKKEILDSLQIIYAGSIVTLSNGYARCG